MRGPAQLATYLGIGLLVTGFILFGVSWNSAAELDTIQQQFPYLMSGGVVGMGFIIAGMTLIGVQTQRELTARRRRGMQELQVAMERLAGLLDPDARSTGDTRALVTSGAPAREDDTTTRVLPAAGSVPAPASATSHGLVIAGRSSFHDPTCRLVEGRSDLPSVPRAQAQAEGRSACRVCKP